MDQIISSITLLSELFTALWAELQLTADWICELSSTATAAAVDRTEYLCVLVWIL